jgi:hypothetical protein
MIEVRRIGSHRTVIDGARRFKTEADGTLTVWWLDGVISSYPADQWTRIDARRHP